MTVRRDRILLLVTGLAWALVYARVLRVWAQDLWYDPNYGHCLPLAAILLFLGFFRWRREPAEGQEGGWGSWYAWGIAAFVLGIGGVLAANDSLLRWSAVFAATAILQALATPRVRRAWTAPILALLLLVPWPYVIYFSVTARLQRLSTAAAAWTLQSSGVPLAREGNLLHFPGYDLEIVDACSGLRSLLTMTAMAGVIAVASKLGPRRTVGILLLAIPLALLSNLLRLALTGYAARLGGPETAESVFHLGGGLLSFGLGALVLGWFAFRPRGRGGE